MTGVVTGALSVLGAIIILMSAVAMLRSRDAYMRISALTPATGLGLPMIVIAAWIEDVASHGFDWGGLARLLLTIVSLLIVSSVGSNVLTRAAFVSGAPICPQTQPNDLTSPEADATDHDREEQIADAPDDGDELE